MGNNGCEVAMIELQEDFSFQMDANILIILLHSNMLSEIPCKNVGSIDSAILQIFRTVRRKCLEVFQTDFKFRGEKPEAA